MTPRIKKAIDIFLDAINKGHLAKGTCAACAVGNLCADGINYEWDKDNRPLDVFIKHEQILKPQAHWYKLFIGGQITYFEPTFDASVDTAKELISKTDFNIHELLEIEKAFEDSTSIFVKNYHKFTKQQIRQDQINGLKAVIEVMLMFDDVKADVNEIFTKKSELIPV